MQKGFKISSLFLHPCWKILSAAYFWEVPKAFQCILNTMHRFFRCLLYFVVSRYSSRLMWTDFPCSCALQLDGCHSLPSVQIHCVGYPGQRKKHIPPCGQDEWPQMYALRLFYMLAHFMWLWFQHFGSCTCSGHLEESGLVGFSLLSRWCIAKQSSRCPSSCFEQHHVYKKWMSRFACC